MFDKLTEYLDRIGLPYLRGSNDEKSLTFLARMFNASFHCILELREQFSVLLFYSIVNVIVPEGKRNAVSELLTRINYELIIGSFEMDFADGEIRFRTSIDFEGNELTVSLIENVVQSNLAISDDYFYSIMRVIMSDELPSVVLEAKERSEQA